VHPYTFRAENVFLPANLQSGTDEAERGDLAAELARYLEAGIDGFFIDHPDLGVGVKNLWQAR
jgi:glycerophosphoryl diester phosphodiesterase